MKLDIQGRIRNMRLPSGQSALSYSVFEAVSNGIHAIDERFGGSAVASKGVIHVALVETREKVLTEISIYDNGVGLNNRHRDSFDTCDTSTKSEIGGHGVGRLIWFKAFEKISVVTGYEVGAGIFKQGSFDWDPLQSSSIVGLREVPASEAGVGTRVILSDPRSEHKARMSASVLVRQLCQHFFAYFIAGGMPKLTVGIRRKTLSVNDYLSSRLTVAHNEQIRIPELGESPFEVSHVYVDPQVSRGLSNCILFTAQKRVVMSEEIEKKFALSTMDRREAYACVVGGKLLDDAVDQERTSFKLSAEQLSTLKEVVLERAEHFLAPHIAALRTNQTKHVVNILEEHPQLAVSVPDVGKYVDKLSPSMAEEEIGKNLFTLLYRHERKVRADIADLDRQTSSAQNHLDSQVTEKVNILIQVVADAAQRRLAEYTIKRHQIVQVARSLLRYTDHEKRSYALERTVHEVVCPMGRMLTAKDYMDHNLWLVDDLLSYYQFFASDKSLAKLGVEGERKEPDIIFFNPFGFRRAGTNDPVVIVEFKRPGDESLSSDPVDQVLGYIEKLRQKTVRDVDGEVVSDIGDETPFECIVVCDLTEGARRRIQRSVAQYPTPDRLGYYGYSPTHRASIKVISYSKMFRDAEVRNHTFFQKLGLLPEVVKEALIASAAPPNYDQVSRQPEAAEEDRRDPLKAGS